MVVHLWKPKPILLAATAAAVASATAAGIPVGHTPGVLVDSTADLAVGLMIAATRRIAEADRWIRTGQWSQGWQSDLLLGTDLSQATVGIVGLGPIGGAWGPGAPLPRHSVCG